MSRKQSSNQHGLSQPDLINAGLFTSHLQASHKMRKITHGAGPGKLRVARCLNARSIILVHLAHSTLESTSVRIASWPIFFCQREKPSHTGSIFISHHCHHEWDKRRGVFMSLQTYPGEHDTMTSRVSTSSCCRNKLESAAIRGTEC